MSRLCGGGTAKYRTYLEAAGIRVDAHPQDVLLSLDAAVLATGSIALRQAGVLFFAREPQRFVKESHLSCVRLNPGGLFSGLSIADLGKRSVRRNRLLADLLFRARYVERVGSGIPRMRRLAFSR